MLPLSPVFNDFINFGSDNWYWHIFFHFHSRFHCRLLLAAFFLVFADATGTKGTQFDSNVGGQTLSFKLGTGAVVTGFDQGIQGMKVGGKRTITIPASQAYGNAGKGSIPGGAPLVFDVEVTAVN